MALPKIDWEEVIVKVLLGIFVIFTTGMTLYAMQGMTEEEKTNMILLFQQWE